MQRKYVDQIDELYEDFHVVKIPLLTKEVRGIDEAMSFAEVMKYAPKIDYFSENEKGKRKKESREIEAEMIVINQP